MAEDEDISKLPYFRLNKRNYDFDDSHYQYEDPDPEYDNYEDRNDQYDDAYGDYNGGYGSNEEYDRRPPSYEREFSPNKHRLGFQGTRDPPDSSSNVSDEDFVPPAKKKLTEEKVIKSLIRCGVPKENLKNLPRNLLKRYQQDYCGLCSQALDTEATARIHYICKNHLKNQKKWLSQQTGSSYRRNKEQPLRARELYCELCDVHITSTIHSQSHYEGKPHRAIVEGRKNPKNPFLMQRGMEDRLEQLIRREKKHLGPEEETDKKEVKAVQPELSCEICNTSVTCTEQMIMHLNGKKHLAKEKRYIFRTMRGEKPQPPGSKNKNNTTEQEKEKSDQRSEEESFETDNRSDSWSHERENNTSTPHQAQSHRCLTCGSYQQDCLLRRLRAGPRHPLAKPNHNARTNTANRPTSNTP